MINLGWCKVISFLNATDAQGFATTVNASKVEMPGAEFHIFLPPFMRQSTSSISVGSKIYCIVDSVTGQGCALFSEDADFDYKFDADVEIGKSLNVQDDITAQNGDVKAGLISLKNHTHPITVATFSGVIDPTTGAAEGSVTGNTDKPAV